MPSDTTVLTPDKPAPVRLRFAPSPNGLLHLGHAYSALLNNDIATALGGECLLRIEDIDRDRVKDEHIAAITRDLHWLGLSYPAPIRYQSAHLDDYKFYLNQLQQKGLLYPCFATRGEIRRELPPNPRRDPDGTPIYPGIYKKLDEEVARRRIEAGEPYALRLHMDKAIEQAADLCEGTIATDFCYQYFLPPRPGRGDEMHMMTFETNPALWGDVIIARKDIGTSYHLAAAVDDHLQGITHICRGEDLAESTDIHRLLQVILGFSAPCYHHHQHVFYGYEKLSKSKGHPSLFDLRQKGVSPSEIISLAKQGPCALGTLLS